MKVDNLEKFFEETYQLARFKEDNASSYAEGLHTAIKRNGGFDNFDYKSFNTSRIPLDKIIVFGGGTDHIGEETEPILENFVDDAVISWNNKFPQRHLNNDQEKLVRNAANDYYRRKLGHD